MHTVVVEHWDTAVWEIRRYRKRVRFLGTCNTWIKSFLSYRKLSCEIFWNLRWMGDDIPTLVLKLPFCACIIMGEKVLIDDLNLQLPLSIEACSVYVRLG